MGRHKQKPNNHKSNNKRSNRAHQVAQVTRQGTTQARNRESTDTRRVPGIVARIRIFTLHTDNEADTQRRRQFIENVKLNHYANNLYKIFAKSN